MKRGISIIEVLFAMGITAVGLLGVLAVLPVASSRMVRGTVADSSARLVTVADREFRIRRMNAPAETWTLPTPLQTDCSYCVDPLGVAELGTTGDARWFPNIDPAVLPGPRMRRVGLRAGGRSIQPMTRQAADMMFRDQDGLSHDLPVDRTLPPVARLDDGRRATEGAFSWFATLAIPKMASQNGRMVRVSVPVYFAVCHRRDHSAADRVCDVMAMDDDSMTISARPGRPAEDIDTAAGRWLLLIGTYKTGVNQIEVDRFGWYLVLHAPRIADGATERDLSVLGQDWPCTPAKTRAVLVDGIVMVAERTAEMEVVP
jgi:type II secretory pathway pseudopilin PulG